MYGAFMTSQKRAFEHRIGKLQKQYASLRKGSKARIGKDGLITISPSRHKAGIPLMSLAILLCGFMLFKAYAFAQMGPQDYNARIEEMRRTNVFGQAVAFIFQANHATEMLSTLFTPQERSVELAEHSRQAAGPPPNE
jgi:hypothetical protein